MQDLTPHFVTPHFDPALRWSQRFDRYGQGAVMGLLSTTFCLANVFMALVGSALILIDTRLVLAASEAGCAWAAWRIGIWYRSYSNTLPDCRDRP